MWWCAGYSLADVVVCRLCIVDRGGGGGEQVRNSAFSAIIEGFTATTYIMVPTPTYSPPTFTHHLLGWWVKVRGDGG